MTNLKWFAAIAIAASTIHSLQAESHCPGNVASLPFHIINGQQIVLPVSINGSGPYNFLLDTGAQITTIDPTLAAQLHLVTGGAATIAGTGFHGSASTAPANLIEVGTHTVAGFRVLVFNLGNIHSGVVGILGEDFLEKFDVLIDNDHKQLCLDGTGTMRTHVKGEHSELLSTNEPANGSSLAAPLVVASRFSDGKRPVRLALDSGANVPLLYSPSAFLAVGSITSTAFAVGGSNGGKQSYFALPPQDVRIGDSALSGVTFLSVASGQGDSHPTEFDGLLPTGLFRRVFIDHQEHYAVLEP